MTDESLTKWRSLLSQLDLNLVCFRGPNYLPYPHPVSTLNEAELENFFSQKGWVWPKGCLPTLTESELTDFESQTGLLLPQGYREFCQVFGAGGFGSGVFFIYGIDIDNLEAQLGSDRCILEACINACKYDYSSAGSSAIEELLNHAYLFGGAPGRVSLIFDLRTYREQDQSYDIYGVGCETTFSYYLG